jgi:Tol biopolymer transport system component
MVDLARFTCTVVSCLGLAVSPPLAAQAVKLNRPLVRTSVADSRLTAVSPDGSWLVYGIYGIDGILPLHTVLHSVPMDGSAAPAQLSPVGAPVFAPFLSTPDSQRVLYRITLGSQTALASSPLDGSAPAVILFTGIFVHEFQLAPDGSRAVFTARATAGLDELFSAPVDGSAPAQRLDPVLVAGGDVVSQGFQDGFGISPDSQWVAYRADQDTDDVVELYAVPIDGSAAAHKLSGALPAPGGVDVGYPLQFGAGGRVLFASDPPGPSERELYSVLLDGSQAAVRLNAPSTPITSGFALSPDGSWVVFTAFDSPSVNVYRVPVGGGTPQILNPPLVAGGHVVNNTYGTRPPVENVAFDSTGTRVIYRADQDVDERIELYSVPFDASRISTKLNQPLAGEGQVVSFRVSPSSPRVAYWSFDASSSSIRSVPADRSSEPVVLRSAWLSWSGFGDYRITPSGQRVVFSNFAAPYDLFGVPLDGSASPRKLTQPLREQSRVDNSAFTLSATDEVVYSADADHPEAFEVYVVPADGSTPPARRSVDLPLYTYGDVVRFQLGPDGREVAFEGATDSLSMDVYAVQTDGRRNQRRLVVGAHGPFAFHPEAESLLYLSDLSGDRNLYAVGLDGRDPPVRIDDPLLGAVRDFFLLTPDGERVLYFQQGLRSAPADGSGPATLLAADANRFEGAQLDPAGDTVFYRSGTGSALLLHATEVDGSQPSVLLGPVFGFLSISPDSARVVYPGNGGLTTSLTTGGPSLLLQTRGNVEPDPALLGEPLLQFSPSSLLLHYVDDFAVAGRQELYTLPADGSGAPLAVAPMPAAGDVSAMALAADGAYAYYLADKDQDEVVELFRVATAGGPSLQLSAALVAGGDVRSFALAGTYVVYAADQDVDEVVELYSVLADGSAAPVKLHAPLPASADVTTFRIAPGAEHVVYRADAEADEEYSLFAARVDGLGEARRLHARPVAGGDVSTIAFQFTPELPLVVFSGDLDEDETTELYASSLIPKVRPAAPAPLR